MSALPRPEPRIRPLAERDLDPVVAIECELYEFPWTLGNFRDSLAAGYSCWTYHGADGLVGYAVGERLGAKGYLGAAVIFGSILVAESRSWRSREARAGRGDGAS